MIALPRIMVAPNGARRGKADHPQLPVTISETVSTAKACWQAGAGGLHAHVRDASGQHVLDSGLYTELLSEMSLQVPEMMVQITTEAVGRYSPDEQRGLIKAVHPEAVSVSLREMTSEGAGKDVCSFYHQTQEAGIALQHILYDVKDVQRLVDLVQRGCIPQGQLQILVVLGRYSDLEVAKPADLDGFLMALNPLKMNLDWAVCGFGQTETACLKAALDMGGKARVGFENNLLNSDGEIAADNAQRVREIVNLAGV